MKIYITGISGVGKSTLVKELNKRGVTSFDLDSVPNLCHWRNKKTGKKAKYYSGIGKDWLEAHNYICDVRKLKKLLSNEERVIVAGSASNQDDFLKLFDKVVLLHCRAKVFLKRLNTRKNNDFGKDKIEQKRLLMWYKDFESKVIKKGAVPIDSEQSVSKIASRVINLNF